MSLDVNMIIMKSLDEVVLSEGILDDAKDKLEKLKELTKDPVKDKIQDHERREFENAISSKIAKEGFKAGEPEIAAGFGARAVRGTVVDAVKEHPGLSAAVVAALAAGVGGLALRKRLKKAKENKENND